MEEKEKKPWRPPEAAHLPDPIAFAMQGFERFGLPKERLIPPLQTFDRVMQHSAFTENRWWENARQVTALLICDRCPWYGAGACERCDPYTGARMV